MILALLLSCTPAPTTPVAPAATALRLAGSERTAEAWGGGAVLRIDEPWSTTVDGATELRTTLVSDEKGQARILLDGTELTRTPVSTEPSVVRIAIPGAGTLSIESAQSLRLIDPVLAPVSDAGRRVVLVFLDTTRADHLQTYGYERENSPTLAAFSKTATVFEQARSLAPWTLPSVRATLTGRQPEYWREATALPELLAEQGFATRASFTNTYLTPSFGMDRGWQSYRYGLKRPAKAVVDDALSWLEELKGRDALLLLQFMDAHLPYREPAAYRGRWAEKNWDGPELVFPVLRKLEPKGAELDSLRTQIQGRYDQNIRFIDDQLARLFEALDPDDIVVIFSDHGEELWEHGGFEHGHAFWDELLHVPLIVRAPGLEPGRHSEPVSLLDITPTILDALDMELPEAVEGRPLADVVATPAERTMVFGRPLYGHDGWGVLHGGKKWWGRAGEQAAFDLLADPTESTTLDDTIASATRAHFDEAWNGELHEGWVVTLNSGPVTSAFEVEISHPEGIARAWTVYAPRAKAAIPSPTVVDGIVTYVQQPEDGSAGSLFLLPIGPVHDLKGLRVKMRLGDKVIDQSIETAIPKLAVERRNLLAQLGEKGFKAFIRRGWQPTPAGTSVSAFDPSQAQELRALGYIE